MRLDKTIGNVLPDRIRSAVDARSIKKDAHGFEVEICQRTLTESGAQNSRAGFENITEKE